MGKTRAHGGIALQWKNLPALRPSSDVSDAKEGLNAGDTLTFTVWRDGRTLDITVKLMDPADIGK